MHASASPSISHPQPPARPATTGVILAGGRGQRMAGADKGLLPLSGTALVDWIIPHLRPQVAELMINANRHQDAYARRGVNVISDVIEGFAGPLAGLHSALQHARTPLVLSVPCDTPHPPDDLAERLWRAMVKHHAPLAIARSQGREHPVFCLCQRELVAPLHAALLAGERKVLHWCQQHQAAIADFDDQAERFINLNHPDQLAHLGALDSVTSVSGKSD